MPAQYIQILSLSADIAFFLFVAYYFLRLRRKEKQLDKREGKVDSTYHQVVDTALSRERKILEDATAEANQIIRGAQYISDDSREAVQKALQFVISDIQRETNRTARTFIINYQNSLQHLAMDSLQEFRTINKSLHEDLQKQVSDLHGNLLPNLQKELDEYKLSRMKQIDQMVLNITQRVAQEVLNKSIALGDHEKLLVDSLEKAKKEGVFG